MKSIQYDDLAPEFFRFPKMDANLLRADFVHEWIDVCYVTTPVWKKIVPGYASILVGNIRVTYDDKFFLNHAVVIVDGEVWLVPYSTPENLLRSIA